MIRPRFWPIRSVLKYVIYITLINEFAKCISKENENVKSELRVRRDLSRKENKSEIVVGLLIPYTFDGSRVSMSTYHSGAFYASAILIALEDINKHGSLLPGKNLSFIWNDTTCVERTAIKQQHYQQQKGVYAYIGGGCHCTTIAKNAGAYDIPMISYMCSNPELSDKMKYPTFARTYPLSKRLTPSLIALLNHYNWRTVAILVEDSFMFRSTYEYVHKNLEANGITISYTNNVATPPSYVPKKNGPKYATIMENIKKKARIIIYLCSYPIAREGMLAAHKAGMINGEFVFIIFELSVNSLEGRLKMPFKWFISHYSDTLHTSHIVKEAFRAVFVLAPKIPSRNYTLFEMKVKKRLSGPPFFSKSYVGYMNVGGTKHPRINSVPPQYAAYLYDAVHTYALALNKTLSQGKDLRDGKVIMENLKGMSYRSILGYNLHFDKNGDVGFNFTALTIKKGEMVHVGDFIIKDNYGQHLTENDRSLNTTISFVPTQTIDWIGKKAPLGSPVCGFDNSRCIHGNRKKSEDNLTLVLAITISIVATLLLIIPVLLYRHKRVERRTTRRLLSITEDDSFICDFRKQLSEANTLECIPESPAEEAAETPFGEKKVNDLSKE